MLMIPATITNVKITSGKRAKCLFEISEKKNGLPVPIAHAIWSFSYNADNAVILTCEILSIRSKKTIGCSSFMVPQKMLRNCAYLSNDALLSFVTFSERNDMEEDMKCQIEQFIKSALEAYFLKVDNIGESMPVIKANPIKNAKSQKATDSNPALLLLSLITLAACFIKIK